MNKQQQILRTMLSELEFGWDLYLHTKSLFEPILISEYVKPNSKYHRVENNKLKPVDDKALHSQKVEAVISRCCLDVLTSPLTRSNSPISSWQRLCCAFLSLSSSANGLNPLTAASLHFSPVIKEMCLLSGKERKKITCNCKLQTNLNDTKWDWESYLYSSAVTEIVT